MGRHKKSTIIIIVIVMSTARLAQLRCLGCLKVYMLLHTRNYTLTITCSKSHPSKQLARVLSIRTDFLNKQNNTAVVVWCILNGHLKITTKKLKQNAVRADISFLCLVICL